MGLDKLAALLYNTCLCRRFCQKIPVVMAKGSHLFPYRTQKLSLSAPMVLGWRRPGRVGHCRIPNKKHTTFVVCFLFALRQFLYSPELSGKYKCTWLGCSWAASCGRNEAHGERPGAFSAEWPVSLQTYRRLLSNSCCFSLRSRCEHGCLNAFNMI